MYEMFKDIISQYSLYSGNYINPTRNNEIIDIIYYNKPEKTISSKVIEDKEGLDHHPYLTTKSVKNFITPQTYNFHRNYKNYNINDVYNKIIIDERHICILEANDSSYALKLLIEMVNDALKETAPLRKITIKKINENKINLSKETTKMIDTIKLQK